MSLGGPVSPSSFPGQSSSLPGQLMERCSGQYSICLPSCSSRLLTTLWCSTSGDLALNTLRANNITTLCCSRPGSLAVQGTCHVGSCLARLPARMPCTPARAHALNTCLRACLARLLALINCMAAAMACITHQLPQPACEPLGILRHQARCHAQCYDGLFVASYIHCV